MLFLKQAKDGASPIALCFQFIFLYGFQRNEHLSPQKQYRGKIVLDSADCTIILYRFSCFPASRLFLWGANCTRFRTASAASGLGRLLFLDATCIRFRSGSTAGLLRTTRHHKSRTGNEGGQAEPCKNLFQLITVHVNLLKRETILYPCYYEEVLLILSRKISVPTIRKMVLTN